MKDIPLISIICLTRNHAPFIRQSLQSDIDQDYPNIEIIVLDNYSTDETAKIAKETLEAGKRKFIVHTFEENIGISNALNFGIKELAKGEYICLNSGDDWLDQSNVSEKINYLHEHPEFEWVYSYGYYYWDDEDRMELIDTNRFFEGAVFEKELTKAFIHIHGAVFSRKMMRASNYFDPKTTIEDWDFCLRALQKFPVGLVRKPLFYYRRHKRGHSAVLSTNFYKNSLVVAKKYRSHPVGKETFKRMNRLYIWRLYEEKKSWSTFFYLLRYSLEDILYFKSAIALLFKLIFNRTPREIIK